MSMLARIIRQVMKRPGWEITHWGEITTDIRYHGMHGTGHIAVLDGEPAIGATVEFRDNSTGYPKRYSNVITTRVKQIEKMAGTPLRPEATQQWMVWEGPNGNTGRWVTMSSVTNTFEAAP